MRALSLALMLAGAVFAADKKWDLTQAQIDDIIQKFAAKESAFAKARDNYTYRQTARIQEADENGVPGGQWEEVTDVGHQQVDEIGCYVFAVKPKKMEPNKRYFSGEVWVDDQDLQIVKSYGRGVGLQKRGEDHQYPKFETYREQIDGKYWFPTYTIANDTLHFKDNDVRIKQTIRYEDYKQFKSEVKITYGDEADTKKDEKKKQ